MNKKALALVLIPALLVTSQASAWEQKLCVAVYITYWRSDLFLRCVFTHDGADGATYREMSYYCANISVPKSYKDPLDYPVAGSGSIWWSHAGNPLNAITHSVYHSWNYDMQIPCESLTYTWKSWGNRQFRATQQRFFSTATRTATVVPKGTCGSGHW